MAEEDVLELVVRVSPSVDEAALRTAREKIIRSFDSLGIKVKPESAGTNERFEHLARTMADPSNREVAKAHLASNKELAATLHEHNRLARGEKGTTTSAPLGRAEDGADKSRHERMESMQQAMRQRQIDLQNRAEHQRLFRDELGQRRMMLAAEKDVRTQLTRALSVGSAFATGSPRAIGQIASALGMGSLAQAMSTGVAQTQQTRTEGTPATKTQPAPWVTQAATQAALSKKTLGDTAPETAAAAKTDEAAANLDKAANALNMEAAIKGMQPVPPGVAEAAGRAGQGAMATGGTSQAAERGDSTIKKLLEAFGGMEVAKKTLEVGKTFTAGGAAETGGGAMEALSGMLGLSSIASILKDNPLASIITATVGVGVAADMLKAATNRERFNLAAAVGGSNPDIHGAPMAPFQNVLDISSRYIMPQQQIADMMTQGGALGVSSPDRYGVTNYAAAFANASGQDPLGIEKLAATMNVGQALKPEEIGKIFDMVVKGADKSGVSMLALTDALSTFADSTHGQALSVRGYASLIAGEAVFGAKLPIAPTIASMANASGSNAIRMMQIMGLSPSQFHAMQTNSPAEMVGVMGQRMSQIFGPLNPGKTQAGQNQRDMQMYMEEQFLQNMGVDISSLSEKQQEHVIAISQGPDYMHKIKSFEKSITKDATAQKLQSFGETVGNVSVNDIAKLQLLAQNEILKKVSSLDTNFFRYAGQLPGWLAALGSNLAKAFISGINPSDLWNSLQKGWPFNIADVAKGAAGAASGVASGVQNVAGQAGNFVGGLFGDIGSWASGNAHATGTSFMPSGKGVPNQNFTVPGYGKVPSGQAHAFSVAAAYYGLPVKDLVSIGAQESGFDPTQTGPMTRWGRARGEMQLMPATIDAIVAKGTKDHPNSSPFAGYGVSLDPSGKVAGPRMFDPYNANQAIIAGAWWLKQKQFATGGNLNQAIANYGEGAAYAAQVLNRADQVITVNVTGEVKTQHGNAPIHGTGHSTSGHHPPAGKHPIPPSHRK